ncbi:MAG: aspartate aminotransferase family protein [Clostridiales bacterium]|jgi:acetylornithine/N-succinyldiaminopimelate aminotransferase|nr:aspartate aminotransferase family protein [Clostridiales bacterium]
MSEFSDIQNADARYIANTYARYPLLVSSGAGAVATDETGERYIDFSSGIGVNSLGFCNARWSKAVKEQLDTLTHASNLFYTRPQIKLAKQLCQRVGMERVFFCNSGAEANECAIKTARKYSAQTYGDGRNVIVTLENSFHGRTLATLAATGQAALREHFGPFPDGFIYARVNDIEDLKAKTSSGVVCAVMIECIQGEGGVTVLNQDFVKTAAKLCAQNDILLIIDEVQTGLGRTGKFSSFEWYGVKPDIVTMAKGLGGGLPIGAALFNEKTKNTLQASDHGSTFGGNPVVCAGAYEILRVIDENFLSDVTSKGDYMVKRLKNINGVKNADGKGLMIGVELENGVSPANVVKSALKRGLMLLTAKHKTRMLPPLTITLEEIDEGLAIFKQTLDEEGETR